MYATLKASAEALGISSMLNDYGVRVTGEIRGDAQVAQGIVHRKGLGKHVTYRQDYYGYSKCRRRNA